MKELNILFGIEKTSSFDEYRKLMRSQILTHAKNILYILKEFERGKKGIKKLIEQTKYFKSKLSKIEYQSYLCRLWELYLYFLDKSDLWNEYITCYDSLKTNPEVSSLYIGSEGRHLTENQYLIYRYGVISRKLERKKKSKSVEHLRHKQRYQLSESEFRRGLNAAQFYIEMGYWPATFEVDDGISIKQDKEKSKYNKIKKEE